MKLVEVPAQLVEGLLPADLRAGGPGEVLVPGHAVLERRHMFGGGNGPWGDGPWNGWWDTNPPFHHPVFVLTHHPREPLVCEGGTTFAFVTDGIEAALAQAHEAAAGMEQLQGSSRSSPSLLQHVGWHIHHVG